VGKEDGIISPAKHAGADTASLDYRRPLLQVRIPPLKGGGQSATIALPDRFTKSLEQTTQTFRLAILDRLAHERDDLVPGLGTAGDLEV
jgi:hypothetical protein